MKQGSVVRYVGHAPALAGMEGYVVGTGTRGPFEGFWVLFAPFRGSDRVFCTQYEVRKLRGFTKSFAKKYATPAFAELERDAERKGMVA